MAATSGPSTATTAADTAASEDAEAGEADEGRSSTFHDENFIEGEDRK